MGRAIKRAGLSRLVAQFYCPLVRTSQDLYGEIDGRPTAVSRHCLPDRERTTRTVQRAGTAADWLPAHMYSNTLAAQKPGFVGKAGLLFIRELLRGCLVVGLAADADGCLILADFAVGDRSAKFDYLEPPHSVFGFAGFCHRVGSRFGERVG